MPPYITDFAELFKQIPDVGVEDEDVDVDVDADAEDPIEDGTDVREDVDTVAVACIRLFMLGFVSIGII